jgi:predicted nuclease of predicted toxin-antitoxin system
VRFLADENFLGDAVAALRHTGHDVFWVRTEMPGSSDVQVLARAQREHRIVLTFDKDFGELVYRAGLPAEGGVILFRLSVPSPTAATRRILAVLESQSDWLGHFAVVEEDRVRLRSLPPMTAET